jgi:hypothetical protein
VHLTLKQTWTMPFSRVKRAAVVAGLVMAWTPAFTQNHAPLSLPSSPGIHVHAYDGRPHKSPEHYEHLCRVVLEEFGIHLDTLALNLVFVDMELQGTLNALNRDRFRGKRWVGVFIKPMLIIMLGEEESDGTFLHEFMHALHHRGLLFTDTEESDVHGLINLNEGLLLGSRSYLEYLKTQKETGHDAD